MSKIFRLASVILLLQLMLLQATPVQRAFGYNFNQIDTRYIMTDIEAVPTISAPSQIYCVNQVVPLSVAVPQRQWLRTTGVYNAELRNLITAGGSSCLFSYTTIDPNRQFNWVNTNQLNTFNSRAQSNPIFTNTNDFTTFVSGMQSYQPTEGAKYVRGDGQLYGSGALYKSDLGVYCKGDVRLLSSNGINMLLKQDYLGETLAAQPITLPSTPGTVIFNSRVDLNGCIASARTYNTNNGCSSPDVVLLYNNSAGTAPFLSSDLTITVLPNFVCVDLPITESTISNPNPAPGEVITYSFKITNNAGRSINVTTIALSSQSISQGFSQFAYSPATASIPAGLSQVFSGSVKVPSSLGTKNFNVDITYVTSETQCAPPNCFMSNKNIININVVPGAQPDYIPQPSAPAGTVGQPFTAQLRTINQGAGNANAASRTRAVFNGGAPVFFNVPALNAGASQNDSNVFTCPGTAGSYPLEEIVDFDGAVVESNESNNNATIFVSCQPQNPGGPVSCTLSSNHGVEYNQSQQGIFTAACRDANNTITYCPPFAWASDRGNMNPTSTPNGTNSPSSTFTAVSIGTGSVSATAASFSCSLPVNVSSSFGNLTLACSLVNHGSVFFPGENATVRADCNKNGRDECPALNWSSTIQRTYLSPTQTPNGTSPKFSAFFVQADAQPPATGQIQIRCADPLECTASCSIDLRISEIPNRLDCSLINHSNYFTLNDRSEVMGRCSVQPSGRITDCPDLGWFNLRNGGGNLTGASFFPNPTLAQTDPKTNFSIKEGREGETGSIDARAISPLPVLQGLKCNATINVSVVNQVGPNYQIIKLQPSKLLPKMGDRVIITVWTKNNGNQPGLIPSITSTSVLPSDCAQDDYRVNALAVGEIDTHSRYDYSCVCSTPGLHKVHAMADADNVIAETNETDNTADTLYYCAGNYTFTCYDYV